MTRRKGNGIEVKIESSMLNSRMRCQFKRNQGFSRTGGLARDFDSSRFSVL